MTPQKKVVVLMGALAAAGAPVTWVTHEGCETCGGNPDSYPPMPPCPDGRSVRWGDET